MLRIENLKAGHLPPLTFQVADGECLAVEGPSGVGKTVLLRAIADLDPAAGLVFLDGVERSEIPAPQWRKDVRYCAAEGAWWTDTPRATFSRAASKPVGFGFQGGTLPSPSASTGIDSLGGRGIRLLNSLGLSGDLLDRSISVLSTGERQRLALARALIDDPKVVLLDEPTASLDPANGALVEELIKFLLLSGRCILLVSHDARQIERLAHARLQLSAPAERPSVVNEVPG